MRPTRLLLLLTFLSACFGGHALSAEPPPTYFVKVAKADLKGTDATALAIVKVVDDGAAARAGVEEGDRILAFDGFRTYGSWELSYIQQFKRQRTPTLELIVSRRGKVIDLLLEDLTIDQVMGIHIADDYRSWPQLLEDLKIPYEPEDITYFAYQSPRTAVELKAWLDADPANIDRADWVKSYFKLRKHLANQEWQAAEPIKEEIPLPLFRQLADFYISVAKRNAKEEQPPDVSAHGVERDFYVFCYPMPRYVLPPLGKYESSHKAFDLWIKAHARNHLQRDPPPDYERIAKEDKHETYPAEGYLDKVRLSIVSPVLHGGWPTRYAIGSYNATDPLSRWILIKELEGLRHKRDSDEALYSYALAQLYGTHRDFKSMMKEFDSLWELSPLLAYRAAVSNHYSLLSARITWDEYNAMEDWRRAHMGPLAPKEPTFLKYVLERSRPADSMPDIFEKLPGDTASLFYPGHLAIALDHPLPCREEFRLLDEAIKDAKFADKRRETMQRLVKAVIPQVAHQDLDRIQTLTRDGLGSGLALDALIEIMEQSQDAPGPPFPLVAELSDMVRKPLGEEPGVANAGYSVVMRTLREMEWKDKEASLAKIKSLYEEHGRIAGTVEIAKALRAQGWEEQAKEYERRLQRAGNILLPRLSKQFLDSGYAIVNLGGYYSASPAMAETVDRMLRLHREAAGEDYSGVTALIHARTLLTLGRLDDATKAIAESYSLPRPASAQPVYTFDDVVSKSDDDYRRWLVKQLVANKAFTVEQRAAILASPAGKDPEMAKLLDGRSAMKAFGSRLQLPGASEIGEATKLATATYQKDYEAARSPQQKRELAHKLLLIATQTNDDPAAKYGLLQAARAIAANLGDVDLGYQIASATASAFDVSELALQGSVLKETASNLTAPLDHYFFGRAADYLYPQLRREALWETALQVAKAAEGSARKNDDPDLAALWIERSQELAKLTEADAAFGPAMKLLERSPVDPKANLSAGQVHAFVRGDWSAGIPLLALADGSPVQPLAKQELSPSLPPKARIALAEGWREVASMYTGAERKAILRHAMDHYRKAELEADEATKPAIQKAWQELFDEAIPDRFLLTELTPKVYEVGHRGMEMFATASAAGRSYPHTLTLHPPNHGKSRAVFELPCPCKYVVGASGFLDMTDGRPFTASQFIISSGERERWRSPRLQEPGKVLPFKVDLRDSLVLEFRVECPGPYNFNRAIWAEPMLQK